MNTVNKKLFRNLGVIVGFFFILLVIIWIVQFVSGARMDYSKLEQTMAKAAKEYFEKTNSYPTGNNEKTIVTMDTLIQGGYLKPLEKLSKDTTCTGNVTVMKNEEEYLYFPKLSCTQYHTQTLKDEMIKKSVTSKDGLYSIGAEYIFKGEYVDNYVKFNDKLWRVINIDQNGNIRMVRTTKEEDRYVWDDRYNLDKEDNVGINNYEVSRIRETMKKIYQNLPDKNKKYLLGQEVCLDKRKKSQNAMESFQCENIMEGEKVTLITAEDFSKASLDTNCVTIDGATCENYNYMSFSSSWTNTPTAEYSYRVYTVSSRGVGTKDANNELSVYPVITISGDLSYISGNGTSKDPYIFLQN